MDKLRINMLSAAQTVDGQGVGSAYVEQVRLVRECDDLFEVRENDMHSDFHIYHMHTVNPEYRVRFNKRHINVAYVHFVPSTLDGSLRLPPLFFWIFKKYVISTYRKADEIVVVNPAFIPALTEIGIPEERITYIPNFVDHTAFHELSFEERTAIRKKYGIAEDAFVVMACGQVQTRKGVNDFISAALLNPDKIFVWAGGFSFGGITDGYKELKEIMDDPPGNVKFLGIVPRSEMNGVFNMSDMLFMPSFSELFPMTILEAANSSKPILLRDLDLYRNILFDNDDLYAKGSCVDDFDAQIKRLASDREFYEHYSLGAKRISEFYSEDRVKAMWKDYYLRIYDKWKNDKSKKLKMK